MIPEEWKAISEVIVLKQDVITSYSIHYTKLYDFDVGEQNGDRLGRLADVAPKTGDKTTILLHS